MYKNNIAVLESLPFYFIKFEICLVFGATIAGLTRGGVKTIFDGWTNWSALADLPVRKLTSSAHTYKQILYFMAKYY